MKLKVISLTIKKIFYALLGVFSPRSGLVPAAIELNRAIAEAKAKYTKTGHRYFCIWDITNRHLVTLTYDGYKGRIDSYQHMRHRGAFPPTDRGAFKDSAFYYSASKNGAPEMTREEIHNKLQLLRHRYYSKRK